MCWNSVTPDIGPADVVRVTYRNGVSNFPNAVKGSGGATTTQNVTATQAFDDGYGNVVIKGKAQQLANGARIALNQFEVRIVNRDFIDPLTSRIGKRDIRADSTGGRIDGTNGQPIPGTGLKVVVRRTNLVTPVIGTARGIVNNGGLFEVNHPGGVCWSGQTPDIGPGNWIDVLKVGPNATFSAGQTQQVINTSIAKTAYLALNGEVRVEGAAVDASGVPIALDFIEQRIINPDFTTTRAGRRDIRADTKGGRVVPGGTGFLWPTGAGGWTAVYSGLNATEAQMAIAGDNRAMAWLSTNANGDRFGLTIFEAGAVGGPGLGGCPARGTASIAIP